MLRLQPTRRQEISLTRLLGLLCEVYNAALEERRGAWRWNRRRVGYHDQQHQLTGWPQEFGVWVVRGALLRLDRAFQSFFRRVANGDKPGFPRFRNRSRWDSIEYPATYSWKVTGDRLYLQGVGHLKFRTSKRGIRGTPKTLVVKRQGHRWYAHVACVVAQPEPLPPTGRTVGIDVGVTHLVATSDGELVDNHRLLRRNLDRLADAQRLVAGRKRGSHRRRKAARRVGDFHRRITRQRRDAGHQLSRDLVNRYDVIVHERLSITNMLRRPKPVATDDGGFAANGAAAKAGLNREISSAAWGQLLRLLAYKAEEAGRTVIAVNPRHTSQTCYPCGHLDPNNRAGTAFACTACGHADHADINAARNILRAGLALRPERAA